MKKDNSCEHRIVLSVHVSKGLLLGTQVSRYCGCAGAKVSQHGRSPADPYAGRHYGAISKSILSWAVTHAFRLRPARSCHRVSSVPELKSQPTSWDRPNTEQLPCGLTRRQEIDTESRKMTNLDPEHGL